MLFFSGGDCSAKEEGLGRKEKSRGQLWTNRSFGIN